MSSSASSPKSKTSKFWAMRSGFVNLGMAERPSCTCQRSHHLRRGLAMRLGDASDRVVVEHAAAVLTPARVEGNANDRRPRLGEDAEVRVCLLHVGLGEVGVQLNLVQGRHDLGLFPQHREVVRQKVAHTDSPNSTVGQQPLERALGLNRVPEVLRHGLMKDEQVDLFDAEHRCTLLEGVQGPNAQLSSPAARTRA